MSAIYSPIWCKGWGEGVMYNSQLTGSGIASVGAPARQIGRFPGELLHTVLAKQPEAQLGSLDDCVGREGL